ncbi:MAG: hypothetical protein C0621_07215 [Desulfuromonas sp.]|nr:MAG: hypothetical protein C0621_07215 [Desulfuromonas sp.]
MKLLITYCLLGIFLLSTLVSSFVNFPAYQIEPSPIGQMACVSFWAFMLWELIKNHNLKPKLTWGLGFFLFGIITAFVYFVKIFIPENEHKKLNFRINSSSDYTKIFILSFCVAILQMYICSIIYMSVGIPFPEIYNLIVNEIIYLPAVLFLKTLYSVTSVNMHEHSWGIGILSEGVTFIYTCLLYSAIIYIILRIKEKSS